LKNELNIKSGLRQSEIRDQKYGEIEQKLSALIGLVKLVPKPVPT